MIWWVAQSLIVAPLLAAGVWVLCRFTRIGPAARHALWLVVLAKLLIPPLVAWPWGVPDPLAKMHPFPETARLAPARPQLSSPHVEPRPERVLAIPSQSSARGTFNPSAGIGHSSRPRPRIVERRPLKGATFTPAVLPVSRTLIEWTLNALAFVWLLGSFAFAAVQAVRIARMICLARSGRPADASLAGRVERFAQRMGIHPIHVRVVDGLDSPVVWSSLRPTLLWPDGLPTVIDGTSIECLIVHELAHVRRRDHWVGWMELVAGLIWWWNPLFWYVRHQLRENAELACDAWVVGTLPSGRRAYAEALLAVCECMSSRRSAPAPALGVGTGGRRFLERRLAMILRDRVPLRLPRFGVAMIALFAIGTLPAFSQKAPPQQPARVRAGMFGIESGGESGPIAARELAVDQSPETLPPDAQELIRKFEQDQAEARRELEERIQRDQAQLVRQLKELQDRYTRAGQLDEAVAIRDRIRAMRPQGPGGAAPRFGGYGGGTTTAPPRLAPGGMPGAPGAPGASGAVQDDPGNLVAYRDRVGQTFTFRVVGSTEGAVWGSGTYTDDSRLAAAAVHAGLLRPGEEGTVTVRILPGQASYEGSDRNGVPSQPYGAWEGSYRFEQSPTPAPAPLGGSTSAVSPPRGLLVRPDPGTLEKLRDHPGETFHFMVTGAVNGPVWGGTDNVYTDDSDLATAAVHAGTLQPGQRGIVAVTILPDRGSYEASDRNGVQSRAWAAWGGSYRIEPAAAPRPPDPPAAGGTAPF
jgi:beta-lactamase regulating signal transducer with metallopeptidase domain